MEDLTGQLRDQLMSYFGDQDRAAAVAELLRDFKTYPETRRIFKEGLAQVLGGPAARCLSLVEDAANVDVRGSADGARRWLSELQTELFPPA